MKQAHCNFEVAAVKATGCKQPGVCRVRFKHHGDTAWRTDYRHLCRKHAVQYRQILVGAGLAPEDVEVCDA